MTNGIKAILKAFNERKDEMLLEIKGLVDQHNKDGNNYELMEGVLDISRRCDRLDEIESGILGPDYDEREYDRYMDEICFGGEW